MNYKYNRMSKVVVESANESPKRLSAQNDNEPLKNSPANYYNPTDFFIKKKNLMEIKEGEKSMKYEEWQNESIRNSAYFLRGYMPYMVDAISALCTLNPKQANGNYIIKNQDDDRTNFCTVKISRKTLLKLAVDNDYAQWDYLFRELKKIKTRPQSVLVSVPGEGLYDAQGIAVLAIEYKHTENLTEKEKTMIENIGGKARILDYIEVAFFKPLFHDCFPNVEKKYGGYIRVPIASYAKFHETAEKIGITDAYISTYYSFALWLFAHISSNKSANTLTINEETLKVMLMGIAPAQIVRKRNKYYFRDKSETIKYISDACEVLKAMGANGGGKDFPAIPESVQVQDSDGLQIVITYKRNDSNKKSA